MGTAMKNQITLIDQVIDLDGTPTHVVMVETTPESTILHLRQRPEGFLTSAQDPEVLIAAQLQAFLPHPILRTGETRLSCHLSSHGGSGIEDHIALVYTPRAIGTLTICESTGSEKLVVAL